MIFCTFVKLTFFNSRTSPRQIPLPATAATLNLKILLLLMREIYKYLYYRIYKRVIKQDEQYERVIIPPEQTVAIQIAVIVSINCIVIFMIFDKIFNTQVMVYMGQSKLYSALFLILLSILIYKLLKSRIDVKNILEYYDNISIERRKHLNIITLAYIIISFLLVIALPLLFY